MSVYASYVGDIISDYASTHYDVEKASIHEIQVHSSDDAVLYFDKKKEVSLYLRRKTEEGVVIYDDVDAKGNLIKPKLYEIPFFDFLHGANELIGQELIFKKKRLYYIKDGRNFVAICSRAGIKSEGLIGLRNLLDENRICDNEVTDAKIKLPKIMDDSEFSIACSEQEFASDLTLKTKKITMRLGGLYVDDSDGAYEKKSASMLRRFKKSVIKLTEHVDCYVVYRKKENIFEIYCDKIICDSLITEIYSRDFINEINDMVYFVSPKPVDEISYKFCEAFKKRNIVEPYLKRSLNKVEEARYVFRRFGMVVCGNKISYMVKNIEALENKGGFSEALAIVGCEKIARAIDGARKYSLEGEKIAILDRITETPLAPIIYPIAIASEADRDNDLNLEDILLIEDIWKMAVGVNVKENLYKAVLFPNYIEMVRYAKASKGEKWFKSFINLLKMFEDADYRVFLSEIER